MSKIERLMEAGEGSWKLVASPSKGPSCSFHVNENGVFEVFTDFSVVGFVPHADIQDFLEWLCGWYGYKLVAPQKPRAQEAETQDGGDRCD